MEDEAKKLLISKIIIKAYEISTSTKHDVFVNYFGNTNNLWVDIYKNGWVYKQGERKSMDISIKSITALDELKKVLEDLKEYERGEEQCQKD